MTDRFGSLASLVLAGLGLLCAGCSKGPDSPTKSAAPGVANAVDRPTLPPPDVPSPAQSVGVFVGVGHFAEAAGEGPLAYTVDDAVDLAHALALDHQLLPESRVRLLLSDQPTGASLTRYKEMRTAVLSEPTKANFLTALSEQASLVGPEGVLYIFVATHGFSHRQDSYVILQDWDRTLAGAVSSQEIFDATQGAAGRVVLFLDSCRSRFDPVDVDNGKPVRAVNADAANSRSPTPWFQIVRQPSRRASYAVLFATGAEELAGGDPSRSNGIFTGALLDGLSCRDASAQPRPVSLSSLAKFAEDETESRSRRLLQIVPQKAQMLTGGGFQDFLLLRCGPIGEILSVDLGGPRIPNALVHFRVFQSGTFYGQAVVFSLANNVFFPQPQQRFSSGGGSIAPALPVVFGLPGPFAVYVGLGAGSDSLSSANQLLSLPDTDSQKRPVYWLGPVQVTVPASSPATSAQ